MSSGLRKDSQNILKKERKEESLKCQEPIKINVNKQSGNNNFPGKLITYALEEGEGRKGDPTFFVNYRTNR